MVLPLSTLLLSRAKAFLALWSLVKFLQAASFDSRACRNSDEEEGEDEEEEEEEEDVEDLRRLFSSTPSSSSSSPTTCTSLPSALEAGVLGAETEGHLGPKEDTEEEEEEEEWGIWGEREEDGGTSWGASKISPELHSELQES